MESVWNNIWEASVARAKALELEGIGERVFKHGFPNDKLMTFPCVVFSLDGMAETINGGSNKAYDFTFPLNCTINDRNDEDYVRPVPNYLAWRQALMLSFLKIGQERLGTVAEVIGCEIEPRPVIDSQLPAYQYLVSGFLLKFHARITR